MCPETHINHKTLVGSEVPQTILTFHCSCQNPPKKPSRSPLSCLNETSQVPPPNESGNYCPLKTLLPAHCKKRRGLVFRPTTSFRKLFSCLSMVGKPADRNAQDRHIKWRTLLANVDEGVRHLRNGLARFVCRPPSFLSFTPLLLIMSLILYLLRFE